MFKTKISSSSPIITITAEWFAQDLCKFGHHLKWGNYKHSILEVGCADGFVTKKTTYPYVRDYLDKLLAVDKYEPFIKAARANNDIDQIEFLQMDVMDESKVDGMKGRFHKIFLPHVAHVVSDNGALLQGLHTMLKPNGQVFFTILVDSSMHYAARAAHEAWAKYVPEKYVLHDYTSEPESYFSNLATRAGFQVHVCENQKRTEPVDIAAIAKAALNLNHKIHLLPQNLQEEYIQDHIRKWNEFSPNMFKYERMVCVASKID